MARVKAQDKSLQGLLVNPVTLPKYQRDAAWPSEKNHRLLESLLEWVKDPRMDTPDHHFYLGNIVTTESDLIVDGQQRFNSLTIIAAALRDVLIQLDMIKHAHKIQFGLLQKHSGPLRYRPAPKDENTTTSKKLEILQTSLCSFPLGGFKSKKVTKKGLPDPNGKIGFEQKFEIKFEGKTVWNLVPGDLLEIESDGGVCHVVELAGSDIIAKSQKDPTRTVLASKSIEEKDLKGTLKYHSKTNELFDEKTELHKSYLKLGTTIYHLFEDMDFESLQKTQSLKKNKDTVIKLMPKEKYGRRWLTPISYTSGHEFELKSSSGSDFTFSTSKNGLKFTKMINIYIKPTKDEKLESLTYIEPKSSSFIGSSLIPSKEELAKHMCRILSEISFTKTEFKDPVDALLHFTIANDGTRMEPLYNYDLFNALTISIIDKLHSSAKTPDQNAAKSIEDLWSKTRSLIYESYIMNDLKYGLQKADEFFGRFCLSKGWLDDTNKRIEWKRGGTEIYVRIEKQMKSDAYYDNTWKKEIEKFYKDLLENAQYHELAVNPLHEVAKEHLEPGALARILVVNKKTQDIFVPLIMSMLDRKLETSKKKNSTVISKALDRVIYHLARFWVLPECIDDEELVKISGKDIYGRFNGTDGWPKQVKDANKADDFVDLINRIENEPVKNFVKNKSKKKLEWPLNKKRHPIIATSAQNSSFLVYAHQLSITKDNKVKVRLLKPKKYIDDDESLGLDKDNSDHPEVEHILPKSWEQAKKTKGSGAGKKESWPNWTENEHGKLLECIGNKTLLEYNINGHIKANSILFKIGKKCAVTEKTATLSYDDSDYDQPKAVVKLKKWEPNHVKKRAKDMMAKICKKWK
tara:strand:- start:8332 stop:10908 length:2577 start_codon:yes stop_codon:yes gene_type:complete